MPTMIGAVSITVRNIEDCRLIRSRLQRDRLQNNHLYRKLML